MDTAIECRDVSLAQRHWGAPVNEAWPWVPSVASKPRNKLFLLAIGLFVLLSTTTYANANECEDQELSWIFCSGFEEGNFNLWDDYDGNPPSVNQIAENPGPFEISGNHVARLVVPPGSGVTDLVKVLPEEHSKIFARWYIQFEPGFDFSTPSHVGGGIHAGARSYLGRSDYRPTGQDWFSGWFETDSEGRPYIYTYYPGMYMDCVDPNGSCWGDHFPCMIDQGTQYCTKPEHQPSVYPRPVTDGQWYCVELMMDGGVPTTSPVNASGEISLWIDGMEIGSWVGLWLRSSPDIKNSIFWLNVFFHGEHNESGVLYDNVVVSTERVGCHGAAAPPRPPSDIRVD